MRMLSEKDPRVVNPKEKGRLWAIDLKYPIL